MTPPDIVADAFANAAATVPRTARALARCWAEVLGRRDVPMWLRRIARRTVARAKRIPAGNHRDLAALILRDAGFVDACRENRVLVRRFIVREPTMTPLPGGRATWAIPALPTNGDVASWLRLSIPELDWLAGSMGRAGRTPPGPVAHYRASWLPKRRSGYRLIEAPKPRLLRVQRALLDRILDHVPPHDAAHGFRRGRSVHTHAAPHAGAAVVIVADLASFFATITAPRVFGLFEAHGFPEAVARTLTGLVTTTTPIEVWDLAPPARDGVEVRERFRASCHYRAPHLPQGAPTSPALANLCAYRLDARLRAAAAASGATYTRYADDLTFSGGEALGRRSRAFVAMVERIARDEGFALQPTKTRVLWKSVRQEVTGLVVNASPSVRRRERELVEAILYNARRDGPSAHNRDAHPDFRAHLTGRVAWVTAANARHGAKLRALLDAIDWNR